MIIKESQENYLETILVLEKKNGYVRSIDIANELGFSKPSVSVAMKNFKNEGYIETDDSGRITLTQKGRKIAENVYDRHEIIAKVLMLLGVTPETAYEDSCRIEHDISEETYEKLKEHVENYEKQKR